MGKVKKAFGHVFRTLRACLILSFISYIISGDTIDLGKGFLYIDDYSIMAPFIIDKATVINERDVPPYVVNFNFDKSYIIAKQNPMGRKPESLYYEERKGDSLVYNPNRYVFDHGLDYDYYWIIDKSSNKVLGPYTNKVFEDSCRNMGISLKLDPKDDHYPSYVPK